MMVLLVVISLRARSKYKYPTTFCVMAVENCVSVVTATKFVLINVVGRQIVWGGTRSAFPSPCNRRILPSTGDDVALMGLDPIYMPYTALTKEVFGTLTRPTLHLLPSFSRGRSFGPALTRKSKISVAWVCWSSMDTRCSTPGTSPVGAGSLCL